MRGVADVRAALAVNLINFDADCHPGKRKESPINQSKQFFSTIILEIVIKPYFVVF
jgi:hypothetical protein